MSQEPQRRGGVFRTAWGILFPGGRESDKQFRRYTLVMLLSLGLLAIVRETMRGMRTDLAADRMEERRLHAEQNKALVSNLEALTSAQATQAASVAVLANQTQQAMAVILDRAHVRIQPVRPQVTTIYVQSPAATPAPWPQPQPPPVPTSPQRAHPRREP